MKNERQVAAYYLIKGFSGAAASSTKRIRVNILHITFVYTSHPYLSIRPFCFSPYFTSILKA